MRSGTIELFHDYGSSCRTGFCKQGERYSDVTFHESDVETQTVSSKKYNLLSVTYKNVVNIRGYR